MKSSETHNQFLRIKSLLSDTSFAESKAHQLVRKVFAEEEVKLEALLIASTRKKLDSINKLFRHLDVIENRFFEQPKETDPVTGEPIPRLVDKISVENLLELYKTLAKAATDLYKDIGDDVDSLKELETVHLTKKEGWTSDLNKDQKQMLKQITDRVLLKLGSPLVTAPAKKADE